MLYEPEQPKMSAWKFIGELSRRDSRVNPVLSKRFAEGFCLFISRAPAGELKTVWNDFQCFLQQNKIPEKGTYPVVFEQDECGGPETYQVTFQPEHCRVRSQDANGLRRAVYFLEDLLLAYSERHPGYGVYDRKPWIKNRISRCFFGPIKRPPLNRDELMDSVDYYPEEYLNKLAHEGINALWLSVRFPDLCKTSFLTPDENREKRIVKLRSTVKRCLSYGMKIYLFCIEPLCAPTDSELFVRNPDLKGSSNGGAQETNCICTSGKAGQRYLYESAESIFQEVPDLGGIINISYGERATTCLSSNFGKECPRCAKRTPGEIHAGTMAALAAGMRKAAPDAELISWLYVPLNGSGSVRRPPENELLSIAEKCPPGVVLQYNFESGGQKEQLGKMRFAGDYWLSYEGPSEIFRKITERAGAHGTGISAKIQVGCSHEVATVPFVPVPGLLYRKYRAMRELGVSHVMQCWYFGNYPGVMNRAAGELAFEDFKGTEREFLLRLARPEWGDRSETVAEAWELLAEAYEHYPLENMFQYYGPMHDGPVWPLHLKPADLPLAPTWQLNYRTSGDRYGECLGDFSLDEILTLCGCLSEKWRKGLEILLPLEKEFSDNPARLGDIRIVKALMIQFESAEAILRFYRLRERLLGGETSVLDEMERIVREEKERSGRMAFFCGEDSRLGFHSEAEGYKYFPAKLQWRINALDELLAGEFKTVRMRVESSLPPFEPEEKKMPREEGSFWKAWLEDGKLKILLKNSPEEQYQVYVEEKRFYPPYVSSIRRGECFEYELKHRDCPVRFNLIGKHYSWAGAKPLRTRLILGDFNPENMGMISQTE